jgi:hypothetical protein
VGDSVLEGVNLQIAPRSCQDSPSRVVPAVIGKCRSFCLTKMFKDKTPNRETVKYSRNGNGWKLRRYPIAEYIELGWSTSFGIEPKIKNKKMKRVHRKCRQRQELNISLRHEDYD